MNYAGGANGGGGGGPKRGEDSGGVGGGGGFNGESASGFVPGSGGFGGGGGGGSQSAGGGGFGGGGGGSYEGNGNPNGGFGGGGGGGAEISGSSGDGGFGGGGAGGANDTSADVGQGGFGGGGGSASNSGGFGAINPGEGGFGSGDGGLFAGSAGAGMGGSIFVVAGGTLTIAGDGSLDGTAKAGARDLTAGNDFYNPGPASAFGAGIFYQGKADGSSSTLNFGLGDQTITATVADYIGSGGTNPDPTETNYFHPAARAADEGGSVALVKSGGGVLALTTANTYSGGTFIKGGTVSDGAVGALGSGPVHFQADPGSAATLLLQKAVQPANGGTFATTLDGLGFGEALNLAGVAYTAGASAVVSGSVLTVTSGGVSQNFTLTNPEAPAYFVHKDAAGSGLLVNAVPVIVQASAGTTFASGDAREFDLTAVYIGKDAAYSAEIISDEGGTYLRLDNGSFSQTFGFGSTDRSFNFDFSSNTAAVTLTGGTFGDRLVGGLGDDTLAGGFGNDTYGVNTSEDLIFEGAGAGTDTVETSLASYTLGANLENLTYTGTGAFTGTGNELANLLTGGAGDDILDGRAGADTLVGGLGNDTYVVENAKDVVTEAAGAGIDTVETTLAKYTLGANVENLTYAGSGSLMGTGNALDNVLTGGAGNDTLRGGAGNDILIGNAGNDQLDGGTGDDLMSGGLGNDTYTVDSLGDRIDESENAGIDQVNSAVSFTLGTNLEKLALTGSAEISGIGNELDNRLVGNGAANLLEGRDGNDTLLGGAGDDTLYGDAGNDQLDGGTGADAMHGGAGNDTYLVDDVGDTVDETVAGGGDAGGADKVTLNADAYVLSGGTNYALSAYVETLSLTGTAALDATGNDLANRMTGNAGANSLVGGAGNDALSGLAGDDTLTGGAGNDTLTGGTGADTFVFGPSNAASADKVTDFSSAQGDRLQFQASDFGLSLDRGLTADKTLADGYFEVVSGKTTVGTENHGQFLFNTSTKVLSWDADGAGNGAAIAVATFAVPTGTAVADFLKASDFYIV